MEQTSRLTSQELLGKLPKIANRDTALRAVTQNVLAILEESYPHLEVREEWSNRSFLDELIELGPGHLMGYSIQEKTPLETPEVRTRLFGLLKHIRTHDTRELCYLDSPYRNSAEGSKLVVRVNEKPVIDACESVAGKTGGMVHVEYNF